MDIDTVAPAVLPFPGLYKDLLFGTRWRSNGKHSAYVILTRGEYIHTLHLDECILGAMGVFPPNYSSSNVTQMQISLLSLSTFCFFLACNADIFGCRCLTESVLL